MYEWSTAGLSHNAGNTAVMGDNFPPLATYFAINERNPVQHRSPAAQIAELSLRGLLPETAIWHTTSANHGGIHKRRFVHDMHSLGGVYIWTVYWSQTRTFVWFKMVVVGKHSTVGHFYTLLLA